MKSSASESKDIPKSFHSRNVRQAYAWRTAESRQIEIIIHSDAELLMYLIQNMKAIGVWTGPKKE